MALLLYLDYYPNKSDFRNLKLITLKHHRADYTDVVVKAIFKQFSSWSHTDKVLCKCNIPKISSINQMGFKLQYTFTFSKTLNSLPVFLFLEAFYTKTNDAWTTTCIHL